LPLEKEKLEMKRKINLFYGLLPSLHTNKLQLVILILFCANTQLANSQNFHTPDSLKDKTYKELYNRYKKNSEEKILYANTYLNKAKNKKDIIRIAKAYTLFASANKPEISLKYCDSIIELTKLLNHYEYPGFGYMTKGMSHYNLGNDQKALDNYLIAYQYARKHNNIEQLLYIESLVGKLKNFSGNDQQALKSFKTVINKIENNKNKNKFKQLYLGTLYSTSNSFILGKKYDSALVYSTKGIKKSLIEKDYKLYYNFVSQTGYIAYYQNNFKAAIDSLDKAFPFETTPNGLLNDHYYRGNIYQKQNKEEKAFYHFKKADSIYNSANDVVVEVRDIQDYFVNYYKMKGDIKNQLVYINRLLKVDSVLNKNYKNINEILIKKYDTPLLLSQKEKIIKKLKNESLKYSYTILGLALIIVVFILFFLWSNTQHKSIDKHITTKVLESVDKNKVKKTKKEDSKEPNTISQDIIESVLNSLKEFETNHDYLENKLTLNKLSKKLNTNSNYLSKIINTHKQMNFSSYISNLRIEYCLKKMKNDSKFRKYTITAISFEIGFNNVESFSKAFYKKTNSYPSTYIKEIEKSTLV